MGIKVAHAITYSILNLNLTSLYNVAFKLFQNKKRDGVRRSNNPSVYIDASLIIRGMTCTAKARPLSFIRLCCCLSRAGFDVVIVCDGEIRHCSKRSTIKRKAEAYDNKITFMKKKCELQYLRQQILEEDSDERKQQMHATECSLKYDTKVLYNKLDAEVVSVGNDLVEALRKIINQLTDNEIGSGTITLQQAMFQADTVLALACKNFLADILFTSDTDQAILCGNDCIGVKKFRFNDKGNNSSVNGFDLFFAFKEMLDNVIEEMDLPEKSDRIVQPVYPILNNLYDIRVRGLIAVLLGCDVTLNNFVSLKALYVYIETLKQKQTVLAEYYNNILNYAYNNRLKSKRRNLPHDKNINENDFKKLVDTLVDAYIYEPGVLTVPNYAAEWYLPNNVPTEFHPYISEFQLSRQLPMQETILEQCDDLLCCVGPGNGSHKFLKYEGYNKCTSCEKIMCMTCSFIHKETKENTYCVSCYASEYTVSLESVEALVPIGTMIQQLHDIGQEVAATDEQIDIIEMYEYYILNNNDDAYNHNTVNETCMYPLYVNGMLNNIKKILSVELNEGGSFITHHNLNHLQRLKTIDLLSALVVINTNTNVKTNTTLDRLYKVIPTIIIKFAEGSRIHKAYRLLRRCLRHASDPLFPCFTNANLNIIEHNNEVGINIEHEVRASMSQQQYKVEVAFTKTNLLACRCTCKAGASDSKNGRSMCVHVLPLIYKLAELLFEGLAEHILINLTSIINQITNDNELLSSEDKNKLKSNVCTLIEATTNDIERHKSSDSTLLELVESFQVGTEKPKFQARVLDVNKLGTLRNLDFSSTIKVASNNKNNETQQKRVAVEVNDNNIDEWNRNQIVPEKPNWISFNE
jgi:hypothetical protein